MFFFNIFFMEMLIFVVLSLQSNNTSTFQLIVQIGKLIQHHPPSHKPKQFHVLSILATYFPSISTYTPQKGHNEPYTPPSSPDAAVCVAAFRVSCARPSGARRCGHSISHDCRRGQLRQPSEHLLHAAVQTQCLAPSEPSGIAGIRRV